MEFRQRRQLKRTKIEIIPMIDTIFFLLVFFMLSSLALVKLNGLPVNLPKASTASRQQTADVTLTIDRNRRLYVNARPVAFTDLGPTLAAHASDAPGGISNVSVIINADLSVPHGLVVHCIDAARAVGISRFAIATTAEDAPEPSETPHAIP